eukprot:TRINITY_DN10978_c0_g1_i15.p1 TRINITY_DN10978_c0_g1~~TRINITY_DN10978_c0_g1_i15.p1  ORF type:complete len:109 (-),score=46.24 TRINITY_DN10978_c0_g1_i15:669-971(-)
MIRRPPRSTHCISSAASDVYKRQVLDLSKLGALLDSLTFWLEAVRKAIAPKSYEETKEDSLKGIVNKVWVMHEDRKYIDLMPVPVMVVGNKYDEFIKEDP